MQSGSLPYAEGLQGRMRVERDRCEKGEALQEGEEMSDYKELLEHLERPKYSSPSEREAAAALRAVMRERDEISSHATKREVMIFELRGEITEAIARAEAAEARLAEFEKYKGDAEKVARILACDYWDDNNPNKLISAFVAPALQSFAAQASAIARAEQREKDARVLDTRVKLETAFSEKHKQNGKHYKAREAEHVARIAEQDAAAIRAGGKQ